MKYHIKKKQENFCLIFHQKGGLTRKRQETLLAHSINNYNGQYTVYRDHGKTRCIIQTKCNRCGRGPCILSCLIRIYLHHHHHNLQHYNPFWPWLHSGLLINSLSFATTHIFSTSSFLKPPSNILNQHSFDLLLPLIPFGLQTNTLTSISISLIHLKCLIHCSLEILTDHTSGHFYKSYSSWLVLSPP